MGLGKETILDELFKASVKVTSVKQKFLWKTELEITNSAPLDIQLARADKPDPDILVLPAGGSASVTVNRPASKVVNIKYIAQNFLIAPEKALSITIEATFK